MTFALKTVSLPNTLSSIGPSVFEDCGSLKTVSMPNNLTSIGPAAFYGCGSLESIVIPSGVTRIEDYTFYNCGSLKTVSLPNTLTSIGSYVFEYCALLNTVSLPKNLTSIGTCAFSGCDSLESITVPSGVTKIEDYAFYSCDSLNSVSLPTNLTSIGSYAFDSCHALKTINLPKNLTSIGTYAFFGCESLESIAVPSGVTRIEDYTFYGCDSLNTVTLPKNLTSIGDYAFFNCRSLPGLVIPSRVSGIGECAFSYCAFNNELRLPAGLKQVGSRAFAYCKGFLYFSGNAPSFAEDAFEGAYIVVFYPSSGSGWSSVTGKKFGASFLVWRKDSDSPQADTEKDPSDSLDMTSSSNIHDQYYSYSGNWSSPADSSLADNGDGTWLRVEHTGSTVIVEQYSSAFTMKWKKTFPMELPKWGGFFAGANYNFIVVGQDNPAESDSVEVMRVIRYSKGWRRIDSLSFFGKNTRSPFEAGSLRMTESNDFLYIHTCHVMYKSGDGVNHQANMSYQIYIPTMEEVDDSDYEYVSHSFNQFVLIDGNDVIKVDHGDAYPRSITLTRSLGSASAPGHGYVARVSLLNIGGEVGDNYTGAAVGGLEASSSRYIVAGNSIKQSKFGSVTQRNIFVASVPKTQLDDSSVSFRWITSYAESANISLSTPRLVKISNSQFLLMWTEATGSSSSRTFRFVFLKASGAPASEIFTGDGILSDCQPVVRDGKVIWYVTSNSTAVFYSIDINTYTTEHRTAHSAWERTSGGLTYYDDNGASHFYAIKGLSSDLKVKKGTLKPNLILPSSLTSIEADAFAGMKYLIIRVPASVNQISVSAFDPSVILLCPDKDQNGVDTAALCESLGLKVIREY